MAMKPFRRWGGADSFRVVLGFTFAHWRWQRARVAWISFAIALSTAADCSCGLAETWSNAVSLGRASGRPRARRIPRSLILRSARQC